MQDLFQVEALSKEKKGIPKCPFFVCDILKVFDLYLQVSVVVGCVEEIGEVPGDVFGIGGVIFSVVVSIVVLGREVVTPSVVVISVHMSHGHLA